MCLSPGSGEAGPFMAAAGLSTLEVLPCHMQRWMSEARLLSTGNSSACSVNLSAILHLLDMHSGTGYCQVTVAC